MDDFGTDRTASLQLNKTRPVEATRSVSDLTPKRYTVTGDQLDSLKGFESRVDNILQWAAVGMCLGSATGALGALGGFASGHGLTFGGFVQNIIFFSSMFVAGVVVITQKAKQSGVKTLIDDLKTATLDKN